MTIAKTIMTQIKAIDFWAFGAWGAKEFENVGDGLRFKTSGCVKWKGCVTVTLDEAKDLYRVKFSRFRKLEEIIDEIVEDVFVEDLVRFIDEKVG